MFHIRFVVHFGSSQLSDQETVRVSHTDRCLVIDRPKSIRRFAERDENHRVKTTAVTRRGNSSKRSRRTTKEEDNYGREWRPMTVKGDLRGNSTTAALHCGNMTVASTTARTSARRVNTDAEKDCSISCSCGLWFKGWQWRDRRHNENEVKIDSWSKVWLGDDRQRDTAKLERYHESVATLLGDIHGATITENSLCGDCVTMAPCEALCARSGDSWLGGGMWQDACLERDRCDDAAWKYSD